MGNGKNVNIVLYLENGTR